jgi:hypothetical protein
MSEAATFTCSFGNQIRVTAHPTDAAGNPSSLDARTGLTIGATTGAGTAERTADGMGVVLHPAADGSDSTVDVIGDADLTDGVLDIDAVLTFSQGAQPPQLATSLGFTAAEEPSGTPA